MCVCACVHARAFFVFLAPTCWCMWRQEVNGLRLGTFLYHPAPYFWRQGFSLIPELTDLERLVSLQVLETLRSPVVEIAGTWSYLCFSFCFCLFAGIRDLNSALYALETSTLLMSLFLLPQTLVAKKKDVNVTKCRETCQWVTSKFILGVNRVSPHAGSTHHLKQPGRGRSRRRSLTVGSNEPWVVTGKVCGGQQGGLGAWMYTERVKPLEAKRYLKRVGTLEYARRHVPRTSLSRESIASRKGAKRQASCWDPCLSMSKCPTVAVKIRS